MKTRTFLCIHLVFAVLLPVLLAEGQLEWPSDVNVIWYEWTR